MLKTGTMILLIGLLFGALYSIVVLVSPQTVTSSRINASAEMQNPVVAKAYYDEARHLGAFALTATIGALFILFAGFKKGQKWAWWAVLCMGIFGWVYGLVRFIIIGDAKNLIGFAIGTALWLIGLLLPIGVFFPRKPAAAPTSQT
jgi:lysylphosphatidylglycerol synthetase-like protein (DUF2156 family)